MAFLNQAGFITISPGFHYKSNNSIDNPNYQYKLNIHQDKYVT
jgi:hypothetical protein